MNKIYILVLFVLLGINLNADQGVLEELSVFEKPEGEAITYPLNNCSKVSAVDDKLYMISSTKLVMYSTTQHKLLQESNITGNKFKNIIAKSENIYLQDVKTIKRLSTDDLNTTTLDYTEQRGINSFVLSEDEKYIFIATLLGISVVEIKDKDESKEVAFVETTFARDLEIKGDYLYLADDWGGIKVFDISDPKLITSVSTSNSGSTYYKIAIENDSIYAMGDFGLRIFDISSPSAPLEKDTHTKGIEGINENVNLHVYDMNAYVIFENNLKIYDVANKNSILDLSINSSPNSITSIHVDKDIAYALTNDGVNLYNAPSDYKNIFADANNTNVVEQADLKEGVYGFLDTKDIDIIKVVIPNGKITISVTGVEDVNLTVINTAGTVVGEAQGEERVNYIKLTDEFVAGTYYLKIESSQKGEYKLKTTYKEDDWTDNKNIAFLVHPGKFVSGNVKNKEDKDYFRIETYSKGVLNILMGENSNEFITFNVEYENNNTDIISTKVDNEFKFNLPSAGRYFVRAGLTNDASEVSYKFKIKFSDDQNTTDDDGDFALKKIDSNSSNSNFTSITQGTTGVYIVENNETSGKSSLRKMNYDLSNIDKEFKFNGTIVDYTIVGEYIYLISEDSILVLDSNLKTLGAKLVIGQNNKKILVNENSAYIMSENSDIIHKVNLEERDSLKLEEGLSLEDTINDFDIKTIFNSENNQDTNGDVPLMMTYLYCLTDNTIKVYDVLNNKVFDKETSQNINASKISSDTKYEKIVVSYPFIYISSTHGFHILRAKHIEPNLMTLVGESYKMNAIEKFTVNDDYAYFIRTVNDSKHLSVLDISTKDEPKLIDEIEPFEVLDISVRNGLAYSIKSQGDIVSYDMLKDYADTKKNAKDISLYKNSGIKGNISRNRSNDIDVFYLNASKESNLSYTVFSDINLSLELFSFNDDEKIAESEMQVGSFDIDAGEYYVKLKSIDSLSAEYDLNISVDTFNDIGDTFTDAHTISMGKEYNQTIGKDDLDIIKVTLENRGEFSFDTNESIKVSLYYGDTKTLIKSDDKNLSAINLNPGTYYIKLESEKTSVFTYQSSFIPDRETIIFPDGFDNIQNYNAESVVYGNRYINVLENTGDLVTYNHLLQQIERTKIDMTEIEKADKENHNNRYYDGYCGKPLAYDNKISIRRKYLDTLSLTGEYTCGGAILVDIEKRDNALGVIVASDQNSSMKLSLGGDYYKIADDNNISISSYASFVRDDVKNEENIFVKDDDIENAIAILNTDYNSFSGSDYIEDGILLGIDQKTRYEFSRDKKQLFTYTLNNQDSGPQDILGTFPEIDNIEDIKAIQKMDSMRESTPDYDFIALKNKLNLYAHKEGQKFDSKTITVDGSIFREKIVTVKQNKRDENGTLITDENGTIVTEDVNVTQWDENSTTAEFKVDLYKPALSRLKSTIDFEKSILDMKINRSTQEIFIINENSSILSVYSYNKGSLDDFNTSQEPIKIDLEDMVSGIYIRENKIYITLNNYGLKVYNLPLRKESKASRSIENIGTELSSPFTYDGSTFNYLSKDNPQVFFLSESLMDGTTSGSYLITDSNTKLKEGCFIATAAYGSYFEKHVKVLRDFRDEYLLTNTLGREFVHFYYTHSPEIASKVADSPSAKIVVRTLLTPLVYFIEYASVVFTLLFLIFMWSIRKYIFKQKELVV